MRYRDSRGVFGSGGLIAGVMRDHEHRPEQERMMEAVQRAIAREDVCLVEAGTGVGKTLAYLAPSLLSGRQTVVATGTRALMDQIARKDVPLLQSALPHPFTATVLKGRANYLCHARLEAEWDSLRLLGGDGRGLLIRLRRWARETPTGDFAELTDLPEGEPLVRRLASSADGCPSRMCPHYQRCFVFAARARARASDLVITNHHLFFADLGSRDDSGNAILPDDAILVFDEAHAIEDVATDHFGLSLATAGVSDLAKDAIALGRKADPVDSRLLLSAAPRLKERFAEVLAGLVPDEGRREVRPDAVPSRAVRAWHAIDADLELVAHEALPIAQGLGFDSDVPVRAARAREAIAAVLGDASPGRVRVAERRGRGGSISALPIEVASQLRERVFLSARTIVLTSATLTVDGATGFFRSRLGVPEGSEECVLASPYDYGRNVLVYCPTGMPEPNDDGYADAFAAEARRILDATRGRAFLLFTSHAALRRACELMRPGLPWPALVQGEAPRDELVRRFRETPNACLLGTATFWEGVDVAGPALSCVIIDRLPFDPPDEPVTRARADAVRDGGRDRFDDYLLPLAVIRLRQGFGRLVRGRSDKGVVAILDRRILAKRYGETFLRSLPPAPRTSDFDEVRAWCRKHLKEGRAARASKPAPRTRPDGGQNR